jgi:hypothetical protein
MNRYFTVLTVSMLFIALCLTGSFAQTNWIKYAGNPILDIGPSGSWDDRHHWNPHVIFDNTTYHMWYSGSDGNNFRVGYATSEDGIKWTKYIGNPVLELGPAGSWDDNYILSGPVLVEGDSLKMWYTGTNGSIWKTGLAISSDGINWTKYDDPATSTAPYSESDPVFQLGAAGSWDDTNAFITSVIFDGGSYKGWYHGTDGSEVWNGRIGYATSQDGIHWIKYDDPGTTDPPYAESDRVLDFGLTGSWDDSDLAYAQVILEGETYHMWYAGGHGVNWRTGYATSMDGIHWTKYTGNPVLDIGVPGTWDDIEAGVTSVIFQDPIYKMWYMGWGGNTARFGYAEDFSQIAHSDSLRMNFSYTPPGSDTLRIKAGIVNPDNHTVTARAQIVSEYSMVIDSTDLTQEGNDLWSGNWLVPEGERTYQVGIKTIDQESGMIHDGIMWNIEKFTTIGPVIFSSYDITSPNDSIPNPGDYLKFRSNLQNTGLTATARDVSANITLLDTCASFSHIYQRYVAEHTYGDIDQGEIVQSATSSYIKFKDQCSNDHDVKFAMEIYSNGYYFWSDTFSIDVVSAIEKYEDRIPKEFALHQNHPNPFNPKTVISWQLAVGSEVELSIYNVLGQKITTLVSGKQNAGLHTVEWDAGGMASGVYYYRLVAGEYVDTKKLVLLK